jgi:hypothetical protein
MKMSWGLLIFALGLFVGWQIRGNATDPSESVKSTTSKPVSPRPVRPAATAHETKWIAFGKSAKDLSHQEKQEAIKNLAPQDRMAALQALASQAGLEGLNYQVKSLMENILENWTDENFDEAWNAARTTTDPDLAKFMMKTVLDHFSKKDPERAFAIHQEQLASDPEFKSNAPGRLLSARLKVGASEYLEILSQIPFGSGTSGSNANFAEDFDFQQAADGLAQLMEKQQGKKPSLFPTNFHTEWAKRDPEAVFAFWTANPSLPFNGLEEILQGMDSASPESSASWLAAKLLNPAMPREKMIEALAGSAEDQAARINGIVRALPDEATADAFLSEVLAANPYGNSLEKHSFVISALSSPAARLEAFQAMKSKHRAPKIEKISDAQLQAWGITRQQAEQAIAE